MNHILYESEFLPDVKIGIVFSENENYPVLIPLFKKYGYGFMSPNQNMVIIDGEQLLNMNPSVLKFIEAHEISHIILGHKDERNPKDEIEADLGAYILLKKYGREDSIKHLLDYFYDRHGSYFDIKKLKKIKKYFY